MSTTGTTSGDRRRHRRGALAETVVPGALGVVWLGHASRPGYVSAAMAGFLLAVAGAVAVARFGKTEQAMAGTPHS
jgi:hypothetical protein